MRADVGSTLCADNSRRANENEGVVNMGSYQLQEPADAIFWRKVERWS